MQLAKGQKRAIWFGVGFLLVLWVVAITPLCVKLGLSSAPIAVDVAHVGTAPAKWETFFGIPVPGGINIFTVSVTWLIMGGLLLFGYFSTRKLRRVPGRLQLLAETFVGMFEQICEDSMGKEIGRKFLPFVATIFIFVLISNWIGLIPVLEEPTRDLNTCLALGILSFFVAHIAGIRYKGIKKYLKEYIEPVGPLSPFLLLLNLVGEVGKTLSHSIRLYGNIMGGAILLMVLGQLTRQIPFFSSFLNFWFGLFVGLVQAFVFAMLAMTYIAVKVTD